MSNALSDYRTDLTWTLMIMGDFGQPQWGERILHAYRRAAGYPVRKSDNSYLDCTVCAIYNKTIYPTLFYPRNLDRFRQDEVGLDDRPEKT